MFGLFKKNKKNKEKKEKLYDEVIVRYIITSILQSTIDRNTLRKHINAELIPIVGQRFVNEFYKLINLDDKKIDRKEIDKWIEILDEEQNKNIS
jgi:hypothetical protein